jgi:hypothetical protein
MTPHHKTVPLQHASRPAQKTNRAYTVRRTLLLTAGRRHPVTPAPALLAGMLMAFPANPAMLPGAAPTPGACATKVPGRHLHPRPLIPGQENRRQVAAASPPPSPQIRPAVTPANHHWQGEKTWLAR